MTTTAPPLPLPTLGRRSEQILATLRAQVTAGHYAPHARLPAESELCTEFEASRTTVRRAIARLAAEGLVRVVHGSGTYVLPRTRAGHASSMISVMFPFDQGSLALVQSLALAQDYLISVYSHTDWSPATERHFLQRVLHERHRALLAFCTPRAPLNDDVLDELVAAGTRVIHVEHYRHQAPAQSYVLPDYRRGGAVAANALMIAGYEHFRYLEIEGDGPFAAIAREGFVEALREQREGVDPNRVRALLPTAFERTPEGQRRLTRLLADLPANAGIVCRTVELAETLADALRQAGRQVPGDCGVIGIKHLLNYRSGGQADHVDFDWQELLRQAIAAATAPHWRGIQAWIRPRLVRAGTVRTRSAHPSAQER